MKISRLFAKVIFLSFLASTVSADLPEHLKHLKQSLGQLKGKLGTLNTKLGELKEKFGSKGGQSLASKKISMNFQELVEMIKKYNEADVNLRDAQKVPFLAKKIPIYETELKGIELAIPKTIESLEITGDATIISASYLAENIKLIQEYFLVLKTLKLNNLKFRNNLIYDIKFKDLDSLEIENIENLCALEISSKVKNLKIFNCDQLGDASVAEGNAKVRVGIRMDKKIGVDQISITGCTKLGDINLDYLDSLIILDLLDCSGLKTVSIRDCSKIKIIDFTGCLNLQSLSIWSNCNQLEKIKIPAALNGKITFNLSDKTVNNKIEYI